MALVQTIANSNWQNSEESKTYHQLVCVEPSGFTHPFSYCYTRSFCSIFYRHQSSFSIIRKTWHTSISWKSWDWISESHYIRPDRHRRSIQRKDVSCRTSYCKNRLSAFDKWKNLYLVCSDFQRKRVTLQDRFVSEAQLPICARLINYWRRWVHKRAQSSYQLADYSSLSSIIWPAWCCANTQASKLQASEI